MTSTLPLPVRTALGLVVVAGLWAAAASVVGARPGRVHVASPSPEVVSLLPAEALRDDELGRLVARQVTRQREGQVAGPGRWESCAHSVTAWRIPGLARAGETGRARWLDEVAATAQRRAGPDGWRHGVTKEGVDILDGQGERAGDWLELLPLDRRPDLDAPRRAAQLAAPGDGVLLAFRGHCAP